LKNTRILHIAPTNTSGVPGQFVLTERRMGYHSRLVTLYNDKRKYFEDICLNLPFIDFAGTKWVKKIVSNPDKITVDNVVKQPKSIPIIWDPHSFAEKVLVHFRDFLWKFKVETAIRNYKLDEYDVYQLDGGLDFYRDSRFIERIKAEGKKVICCYTGSDLRTRGVIRRIDQLSEANFTVEFDHLKLHPDIHHVFFPFEVSRFQCITQNNEKIRIGHAPTNRKAKGSDIIIPIMRELTREYNVEAVVIQNLPYSLAIETKQSCDIFIDQIGDLGYGINSLEALAMGIPCCSCLAPGFAEEYPDHPFVQVNKNNLKAELLRLIQDTELRKELGFKGREWVEKYHDSKKIVRKIHDIAGIS